MYGHWWYLDKKCEEFSDFGRVLMNYINHSIAISEYIKSGRLTNRGLGRKVLILESDLEGVKPGRYTHYPNNN